MVNSILEIGRRIEPLNFNTLPGKRLTSIIKKNGEVFKVTPYNIPQQPLKVSAFCLHHLIAMIDTGILTVGQKGHFITEGEAVKFREMASELLVSLNPLMEGIKKEKVATT
ncbi:MAG: hypothetical protein ABIH38_04575 [Patescibacteria group bacterium]